MVVDDDADMAESLAALLTLRHYDARTAYDVESALQVANDFEPDAVVLDINMPRIDGYAAAAALFRIFPSAPPRLIAFTARSAPADVARARQAGFDFYVSKSLTARIFYICLEVKFRLPPTAQGQVEA